MKKIQAYFTNENDAESVRAKLQTLNVENVTVEEIPENSNIIRDLIHPEEGDQQLPQVLQLEVVEEDYQEATAILKESSGHMIVENK
ncbi:hypothetical protein NC797_01555 [Aquibacillus sp. 3ASR75-11]|uniref:Signal transducing protein n=1 Tax=Terrihalobacillus insolitus TaxID=2950438 RepID=A0A9X3WQV4_9BACI|nr:hypothetical protein [Terrihalobacillus insolitus]MDC3412114.1 hypothetical protein [Terrihalobacillus insolitus]MDC3423193.1 hypothetical protein [Terrihalobacillus insolitus]